MVISTFLSLAIFNSFLLDLMGWPIDAWAVLIATLLEMGAVVLIQVRRSKIQIDFQYSEFIGFASIVLFSAAYLIYPSLPALLPPSHHYDAVHPIVLSDYIYENNSLPHDFTVNTKPYFPPGYPVGGALVVALFSHWLGRIPIQTLHPFISLILGLTAGLTFRIINRLLPAKISTPIALLSTLFVFSAWAYFPGLVNERYFFGQTFAQFFALLTFLYLIDYAHEPDTSSLLLILACLATVLFSHPSPLVTPALGVVIALAVGFKKNFNQTLVHSALLALGIGAVVVFYVLPRWSAWVGQTGYGEAAPFTLESLGLVLPALGGLGFALALRRQWRDRFWIAFLLLGAVLAQPITLFFGRLFIEGIGTYYFEKSLYLLIYPLAIFAALALTEMAVQLEKHLGRRRVLFFTYTAAIVCVPIIFNFFPPRPFAPLTASELRVANWAKTRIEPENLGYISPFREDGYWIQTIIYQVPPSTRSSIGLYNLGSMTFEEWRGNPGKPDYAIVRNIRRVPDDPTVETIYQVNESAILRKTQVVAPASPKPHHATQIQVVDLFNLVGYDIGEPLTPGSPLTLTFYWEPRQWPRARVAMFIQILDGSGNVVTRLENEMFQKKFPTQRWPLGVVTTDTWTLQLPADIPPGDYTAEVAVLDQLTGTRMQVIQSGAERTEEIMLGPFRVSIAEPSIEQVQAAQPLYAQFGESIALRAYTIDPLRVRPGGSVRATLYWTSLERINEDYVVFVHLVDLSGRVLAQVDSAPQNGTHPTSTWRPGEIIKDPYWLRIPQNLPPGNYQVRIGLYTPSDLKRVAVARDDNILLPQTITVE